MKIQLIAVAENSATVAADGQDVQIPIEDLREAANLSGHSGQVYQWLLSEHERCLWYHQNSYAWRSPLRDVDDIGAAVDQEDERPLPPLEPNNVAVTLPNGREIRYEGDGYIVQPYNDNEWITAGTIEEAMEVYEGKRRP